MAGNFEQDLDRNRDNIVNSDFTGDLELSLMVSVTMHECNCILTAFGMLDNDRCCYIFYSFPTDLASNGVLT